VEPTEICEIDFSRPDISENFKKTFTFKSNGSGSPQAVFFWWNLQMNPSASNLLSCAPWWAHPDIKNISKDALQSSPQNLIPWRDHWMQGIFYLNGNNFLNSGQEFSLTAYHDKFSWWFSLDEDLNCRPICECLFHMNSRTRIAEINDSLRTKKFMKLFERLDFQNDQEILILGDNCLIALCLAKLGAKLINILEENSLSRKVTNQFIESNQLENSVKIHENLDSISKVSLVFAEPHFLEADLPWDNISEFLKRLKVLREKFGNEFKIIPTQAKIYAVPVHFLDLYKIRSPLGEVESFDHRIFDQFIEVYITFSNYVYIL
jgi:protein arginine N-methyltransferase 7